VTGPEPDEPPSGHDPLKDDSDHEDAPSTLPPPAAGPPGGGIFSLEGRRAPGLYLVAWILLVGGLAVTFVLGPQASDRSVGALLIAVGSLVVAVGFAAAAGSQMLERADRHPGLYRGPSPLLVFGAFYFAMSALGVILDVFLGIELGPDGTPFTFLAVSVVQASAYVLAVWLFAVKSGTLGWREMGWPRLRELAGAAVVRPALIGLGAALPLVGFVLMLGTAVGLITGVEAPRPYPSSANALDGLLIFLAAAVIVPLGEELYFRGFALTAWQRDLGDRAALHRTSIFFALLHVANVSGTSFGEALGQVVLVLAVILPVGYALGWLRLRFGLVAAIAGHIGYNSILLALAYLASQLPDVPSP
jgi:membrane protease YdiL (CAAX protease family)